MIAEILASAAVAGVIVTGSSLVVSLRRNGKQQRERDEANATRQAVRDKEVEMGYRAIVKRLDHPDDGLSALGRKVTNLRTEHTEAIGRHDEHLTSLESR